MSVPSARKKTVLSLTVVGAMSALATVIYLLFPEIPLVPGVEYLKIDLSDIPALLTGVILGPLPGIAVEIIKNGIHLLRTTTFGIGELMNIGVGTVIVCGLHGFSALFSRLLHKQPMHAAVFYSASVLTVAAAIAAGWLLNGLLTPLYFRIMGIPLTTAAVLAGVWGSTLLNAVKAAMNLLPLYPLYLAVYRAKERN